MTSEAAASIEEAPKEELPDAQKRRCVVGLVINLVCLGVIASVGFGLQIPVLAGVSVAVNYVVFLIHALPCDSEKFFDATGTLTYITLVAYVSIQEGLDFTKWNTATVRALILVIMSMFWAIRLGSFLLNRICQAGKDSRFDELRKQFLLWLSIWSIQALWCFLVISPVLVIVTKNGKHGCSDMNIGDYIGWAIWVFGIVFEITADQQKTVFKKDSANKGRFITTGLWAHSRHPNYFGEIVIWIGISISATSSGCLSPSQYLLWLSPVTSFILLNYVTGVPLLEKGADERWGEEPAYKWYKEHTPVLFPSITRPPAYNPDSAAAVLP